MMVNNKVEVYIRIEEGPDLFNKIIDALKEKASSNTFNIPAYKSALQVSSVEDRVAKLYFNIVFASLNSSKIEEIKQTIIEPIIDNIMNEYANTLSDEDKVKIYNHLKTLIDNVDTEMYEPDMVQSIILQHNENVKHNMTYYRFTYSEDEQ